MIALAFIGIFTILPILTLIGVWVDHKLMDRDDRRHNLSGGRNE